MDERGIQQLGDGKMADLATVPAIILSTGSPRRLGAVVQRLAEVIEDTVVLAERSDLQWRHVANHVVHRPQPASDDELWRVVEQASTAGDLRVAITRLDGRWTVLPISLSGARRAALLLAGDWRLAAPALTALADQVTAAFRGSRASASGLRRASHRLAQRLARTHGVSPVCTAIVESMATAVRARLGAIAIPDSADRGLSIKATFGYPLILVEHVRIEPGEGVFGQAYQSGRVLRVPGSAVMQPGRRRPRYRTDSFIAIPILAAGETLAVVCVADRVDDRAFTRTDVSTMRALAAPSALALARERAAARAEAYAHAAAVDPLSGLFNRRYFHVRIEEELERSRRHGIPLALLMIDIDDFKAVNDAHGHLAGDAVIKDAADIVRRAVRVFDVCTRFGGEEFAVIMPASSDESARAVAERIRARVAAYRTTADHPIEGLRVSVSIGLALSEPGIAAHDLIERADAALYAAKRGGKNRVRSYAPRNPT